MSLSPALNQHSTVLASEVMWRPFPNVGEEFHGCVREPEVHCNPPEFGHGAHYALKMSDGRYTTKPLSLTGPGGPLSEPRHINGKLNPNWLPYSWRSHSDPDARPPGISIKGRLSVQQAALAVSEANRRRVEQYQALNLTKEQNASVKCPGLPPTATEPPTVPVPAIGPIDLSVSSKLSEFMQKPLEQQMEVELHSVQLEAAVPAPPEEDEPVQPVPDSTDQPMDVEPACSTEDMVVQPEEEVVQPVHVAVHPADLADEVADEPVTIIPVPPTVIPVGPAFSLPTCEDKLLDDVSEDDMDDEDEEVVDPAPVLELPPVPPAPPAQSEPDIVKDIARVAKAVDIMLDPKTTVVDVIQPETWQSESEEEEERDEVD